MFDKIIFCGLVPVMLIMAFFDGGYQHIKKAINEIKKTWKKL